MYLRECTVNTATLPITIKSKYIRFLPDSIKYATTSKRCMFWGWRTLFLFNGKLTLCCSLYSVSTQKSVWPSSISREYRIKVWISSCLLLKQTQDQVQAIPVNNVSTSPLTLNKCKFHLKCSQLLLTVSFVCHVGGLKYIAEGMPLPWASISSNHHQSIKLLTCTILTFKCPHHKFIIIDLK